MQVTEENMKPILLGLFRGLDIHGASWNEKEGRYEKSEEEACIEAADGDKFLGLLLHYFSCWMNDVASVAAHYGIGYIDGKLSIELPPAPSPDHWWSAGKWNPPFEA